MTLTRALGNANSGLAAASFRAEIAANNVANANTPGYVKRTVDVTESRLGGQSSGVTVAGVTRTNNPALTAERRQAEASAGRADIISQAFSELNRTLGEPDDTTGLFNSYQRFETALRELTVTPESPALQNALYGTTADVVSEFNSLYNKGQQMRIDADASIENAVTTVNTALKDIADLNQKIISLPDQSTEQAALLDERQLLVDQVSQFVPVKQLPAGDGAISLLTNEGVFLLSGQAREIEFTRTPFIGPGATYDNGAGVLSGLRVGDQDITPGSNGTFAVQSGLMAGYFAVRDEVAFDFLQQVDSLAADLVARFSDDSLDPTKAAGAAGIFTDNGGPVDPTNIDGIAQRMTLNAAVDPAQGGLVSRFRDGVGATTEGPAGDATIPANLLEAFNDRQPVPAGTGLTGTLSISEAVAGVTSLIGEERVRSDAVLSSARARAEILSDAEIAETAVDTDQELQSLLLIEQAYTANARVIQTINDMFNRLLEI
ncbi:flagellar hook-associated protein FlgK [Parvularcula sp. IMCC14364]|uniref:flagellar hook-associated protein FlgK n=1 Tax=Parvularcula sp. IMCC14364 TaxID=3067902 RepID=UPI00274132A9|nr:flagellar hook-associated protein FlgK [Parvularcula sp. IMCC14364]